MIFKCQLYFNKVTFLKSENKTNPKFPDAYVVSGYPSSQFYTTTSVTQKRLETTPFSPSLPLSPSLPHSLSPSHSQGHFSRESSYMFWLRRVYWK